MLLAALAALGACGSCRDDDPPAIGKAVPAAGKTAPLAGKPFYRIDAGAQARCAAGAMCEVPLVLTALGDYHVNKDYPFKFVGDPEPAPPVDGDGRFAFGDTRHGTLTVTLRPAAPGTVTLAGTFKLSVCNDDNCQIETPRIELVVPVG